MVWECSAIGRLALGGVLELWSVEESKNVKGDKSLLERRAGSPIIITYLPSFLHFARSCWSAYSVQ